MLNSKIAYKRGAVNEAKVIHFFDLFNNKKIRKQRLCQANINTMSILSFFGGMSSFGITVFRIKQSNLLQLFKLQNVVGVPFAYIDINVSAQNVHLYKLDHWFHEKK